MAADLRAVHLVEDASEEIDAGRTLLGSLPASRCIQTLHTSLYKCSTSIGHGHLRHQIFLTQKKCSYQTFSAGKICQLPVTLIGHLAPNN